MCIFSERALLETPQAVSILPLSSRFLPAEKEERPEHRGLQTNGDHTS